MRSFASGHPIRDAAHVALLSDVEGCCIGHAMVDRSPAARPWRSTIVDALIRRVGNMSQAETAPRDSHALARRIQLIHRVGGFDGVMLVLLRTSQTRRFLAEAGSSLASIFPVDGARAVELLRAGVDPGGGAIIVVPGVASSRPHTQ
jgi:hypothetical protein